MMNRCLSYSRFVLSTILLLLPIISRSQGWVSQSSGGNYVFGCVAFSDSNTGWIIGINSNFMSHRTGFILHTSNGGGHWVIQDSIPDIGFTESVSCTSDSNVWALMDNGVLLHSLNAGIRWTQQTLPTTYETEYISMFDATTGWVVCSGGVIFCTTNSGMTWEQQASGTTQWLNGVCAISRGEIPEDTQADYCWAVGDSGTVLYTTNQGQNWGSQLSGTTDILNCVTFLDSIHGWAVGGLGTIIHTNNGGRTWTAQNSGTTTSFYSVSFVDLNYGWAVGSSTNSREIIHTTDGGTTWINDTVRQIGSNDLMISVCFTSRYCGWAVENGNTIIHYTGTTWVPDPISNTLPSQFTLSQNYPNPFNSSTTISYSLPKSSPVELKLYDITGRVVSTLVNGSQNPGYYQVPFDANHLSSGVYFYRLNANGTSQVSKLSLVK